jgi:hypothetical protein
MNRHIAAEALSAYIDGELPVLRSRALESHLSACHSCRDRLAGMRQAIAGLRGLERVPPPALLGERVRREVEREGGVRRGLLARIRAGAFLGSLGLPALATPLAAALALLLSLLLVERQSGLRLLAPGRASAVRPAPEFRVEEGFGEAPLVLPQTTSEVAGRVFVFTDNGWVQRGIDARAPEARIHIHSRQGRLLLAQLSDLDVLLADGSRVVLRYNLRTLELLSR